MEAHQGRTGLQFETVKVMEDHTDQSGRSGVDTASSTCDINISSPVTRQKVAAAKQFIENHYKNHLKSLQERKERLVTINIFESSFFRCTWKLKCCYIFYPVVPENEN